jgi:voltage-gated potassium channel
MLENNNIITVKQKLSFMDILTLILSIFVLVSLTVEILCKLDEETKRLLQYFDNISCGIFILDFFIRMKKASNKWKFFFYNWIDLLASIPMLDAFRYGRLFRLLRLLRILRAFRSVKNIISFIFKNKTQGAFTSCLIVAILMIMFSSIGMLHVETDPASNIKTAEDAVWWACTTITTVGYGDKYPITTEGRIIAVMLMFVGVGLFGTFTGFISSWFTNNESKDN